MPPDVFDWQLYTLELVGDRDPRSREFYWELRALDREGVGGLTERTRELETDEVVKPVVPRPQVAVPHVHPLILDEDRVALPEAIGSQPSACSFLRRTGESR
jgi:hypothetical protein